MTIKNLTLKPMTAATSSTGAGVSLIASGSLLTRLNYYDGKFLRASDMLAEQTYLRNLVAISNQAGGFGVAWGYSVTLPSGTQFQIGDGLAIDPKGRLLLLSGAQPVNLADLLATPPAASTTTTATTSNASSAFGDCPPSTAGMGPGTIQSNGLYLLVICHAETLCGQADVYGNLCQEACVTSTDSPWAVEGIVVQLVPLTLAASLPVSTAIALGVQHLRSRVASAYFQDETAAVSDLISGACLQSNLWCMGADGPTGCCIPLGVVGLTGTSSIAFFDAWTARRERIDVPAKRYWQWRMAMRPWDVFLAQVLQFQCQLQDGLGQTPGGVDPCAPTKSLTNEAASVLTEFNRYYQAVSAQLANANLTPAATLSVKGGASYVTELMTRLSAIQTTRQYVLPTRLLINQGIIELPSAGYLPVTPGSALTVNQQVLQWMGEGVNLRYCIVTPDYVPHALEEAQHMERISLIEGIDDSSKKPDVDILVPNGQMQACVPPDKDLFYARINLNGKILLGLLGNLDTKNIEQLRILLRESDNIVAMGAARAELLDTGGGAFYLAAETKAPSSSSSSSSSSSNAGYYLYAEDVQSFADTAPAAMDFAAPTPTPALQLWTQMQCEKNVLTLNAGQTTSISLRIVLGLSGAQSVAIDLQARGDFRLDSAQTVAGQGANGPKTRIKGRIIATGGIQIDAGGQQQSTGGPINLTTTFLIEELSTGPKIGIAFADAGGSVALEMTATWRSQSPIELNFALGEVGQDPNNDPTTTRIANGSLLETAAVAKATDPYHVDAVNAISALATELGDSGFSVTALKELFPSLANLDSPDVTGTACWVMFRRRRKMDCGTCETVTTVTRRYRVYVINPVTTTLATGLFKRSPALTEVGIVEFTSDSAILLSPATTLLSEWQNANTGSVVVLGDVYSMCDAATDGDALAVDRLNTVEMAVSDITPVSPNLRNNTLSRLPAGVNTGGVEGIIILRTENSASSSSSLSSTSFNSFSSFSSVVPPPPSSSSSSSSSGVQSVNQVTAVVTSIPVTVQPFQNVAVGTIGIAITATAPTTVNILVTLDTPVVPITAVLTDNLGLNNLSANGSGTSYQFTGVKLTNGINISILKMETNATGAAGRTINAFVAFTSPVFVNVTNPSVPVDNVVAFSSSSASSFSTVPAQLKAAIGSTPVTVPAEASAPAGNIVITMGGSGSLTSNLTILMNAPVAGSASLTDNQNLNHLTATASGNTYVFSGVQLTSTMVITISQMTVNTTGLGGNSITADVVFAGPVSVPNSIVPVDNVTLPSSSSSSFSLVPLTATAVGPNPMPVVQRSQVPIAAGDVKITIAGPAGERVNATMLLNLLPNKAVAPLPTLIDSLNLNAAASTSIKLLAGGAGWEFDNVTFASGQTLIIHAPMVDTNISLPAGIPQDTYVASVTIKGAVNISSAGIGLVQVLLA